MKRCLLLLCLIMVIPLVRVSAQETPASIVVAEYPNNSAVRFVRISADATVTTIGTLPDNFRLWDYQVTGRESWGIEDTDQVSISPDGQYAMVSAVYSSRDTAVRQVFLFRTDGQLITSFPGQRQMRFSWSPDSSGVLLLHFDYKYENALEYFDVATQHITALAKFEQAGYPFEVRWIDARQFVFISRFNDPKLILLDLDGGMTVLFRRHWDNPDHGFATICPWDWSARLQRLFVSVGCAYDENTLESVYEVDLQGNATLILSAPEALQNSNYSADYAIFGIEASGDSVYVLTSEYLVMDVEEIRTRRLLRWHNESWTEITGGAAIDVEEVSVYTQFAHLRVSPDGRYAVMGRYGYEPVGDSVLIVVDLNTGDIVRRIPIDYLYSESLIWLNHYQFVYGASHHGEGYPMMGDTVLIVDLSRTPVDGTLITLDAPVWLPQR